LKYEKSIESCFLVGVDGVLTMRVVGEGSFRKPRFGGGIGVWLCFILHLLRMMYVKYCMDAWMAWTLGG
jgi:hypothetical protein